LPGIIRKYKGQLKIGSKIRKSRVCWHMPVILVPERLKQEDCEFEVHLGYMVRSYLKKKYTLPIEPHHRPS
jgi:hypothetical protein